MTQGHWCLV